MVFWIIKINIWLAIFNLIPIPPLDGSKVLFALLPPRFSAFELALERYGFFILIILIFVLPGIILVPLANFTSLIIRFLAGV